MAKTNVIAQSNEVTTAKKVNQVTTIKPVVKKESLHAAKIEANKVFKEKTFSMFGLINYISKELKNGQPELKKALNFSRFKGLNSQQAIKDVLTIDYLKTCLGEKGLHHWSKDAEGKFTVKGEERKQFSFYTVLQAIQKHEKAQK